VPVGAGQKERHINEAEAAVVRTIYERFADGDGLRTISLALNNRQALSPRAQRGRPNGWSSSSVRAVLTHDAYRGIVVCGRSAKAYDRELGTRRGAAREKGQIPKPEGSWFRSEQWADRLRIVTPDLAARVDERRMGPLEMSDPAVPSVEWTEWEASLTPALLEGLAPIKVVASPTGFEPVSWP
jgi:Recombinase